MNEGDVKYNEWGIYTERVIRESLVAFKRDKKIIKTLTPINEKYQLKTLKRRRIFYFVIVIPLFTFLCWIFLNFFIVIIFPYFLLFILALALHEYPDTFIEYKFPKIEEKLKRNLLESMKINHSFLLSNLKAMYFSSEYKTYFQRLMTKEISHSIWERKLFHSLTIIKSYLGLIETSLYKSGFRRKYAFDLFKNSPYASGSFSDYTGGSKGRQASLPTNSSRKSPATYLQKTQYFEHSPSINNSTTNKHKSEIGNVAELIVLEFERKLIENEIGSEFVSSVYHSSVDEGDGLGYDIKSINPDFSPKYIEVKGSILNEFTAINLSRNELEKLRYLTPNSFVYLVTNVNVKEKTGDVKVFPFDDLIKKTNIVPTSFRFKFSKKESNQM